jgi:hypothetical protein
MPCTRGMCVQRLYIPNYPLSLVLYVVNSFQYVLILLNV